MEREGVWSHLPDDALREHITANRKAADAMEAELIARHEPIAVMVPRSLLLRVQHVLLRPGLAQGDLSWDHKAELGRLIAEALTKTPFRRSDEASGVTD